MTDAQPQADRPIAKPFHLNHGLQIAALLFWVVGWMLVESLLDRNGFKARQQVAAFAALLAGLGGTAFLLRRQACFQLLTSVPFAISQVLFMAMALVVGTLVVQQAGPADYARHYGPGTLKFLAWTHVTDLYHSLGFYALLSLLALSMLCVAWKRRPYPAHRLGFLLVHVSTSLILLGALWGKFSAVRAYAELRAGEPVGRFFRTKGSQADRSDAYVLPGFRLRLDRFTTETYDPEFKLYAFVQPDGKGGFEPHPKAFEVTPGMKGRLPLTHLQFQVLQLLPTALEAGEFIDNPQAPEEPALRVMLGIGEPRPVVGDLFAHRSDAARRDEPGGRFAVVYQDRWTLELLDQLQPRAPKSEKLVVHSKGQTFEHDAPVGATWEHPDFTLKVLKYYPDFAIRKDEKGQPQAYSRSANPLEPWLELSFAEGGQPARRVMLSARNPDLSDQLNAPNLPQGFSLRYQRKGEETQARFVVFTRTDRTIRLVERGRVARSEPLTLNKPFLVAKGLSATAVAALEHADYVPGFTAHPDPKEALKFNRPVLRVRVWDPGSGRAEEKWLEAKGPNGLPTSETFLDRRVGLVYQTRRAEPKNFHAVLVVLDEQGQELTRKTASMNDPLIFRGHWFHLSNYNPEDPRSCGVMVTRDPGFWWVCLGFGCLLLGTAWMFYLKPVLKRRAAAVKEV